jgi:hypothetical protein
MKIDDRIDAIVDADMLYTYAKRGVKDTGNVWSQLRNPTKS